MDNNHIAGIFVGAIIGIGKAISFIVSSFGNILIVISLISWEQAFDAGSLALIGGACGWLGAEVCKRVKKFLEKRKKK